MERKSAVTELFIKLMAKPNVAKLPKYMITLVDVVIHVVI